MKHYGKKNKYSLHSNNLKKIEIADCLCSAFYFKWQKFADIGIPETPTPLELANVGNRDTPPALKMRTS